MSNAEQGVVDPRIKLHQQICDAALSCNGGDRSFREWKAASLDELREQADLSPRMQLLDVNLQGDLKVVYRIAMPVPRWPLGDVLTIGDSAVFHLTYRDQWRTEPPAGWEPVGLFKPLDIFHPNSSPSRKGALCLGQLPAGIAPSELVLLAYYLASLQDYTLNEQDPAGVLNPQACEWFRCHSHYLPLTHAGLFDPWDPEELEHARRR